MYFQESNSLNKCDELIILNHTITVDASKECLSYLRIFMALQNERLSLINGY